MGNKTKSDKIDHRPYYRVEKFPEKEEISKLVYSSEVKTLDSTKKDIIEYIKELEKRVNK